METFFVTCAPGIEPVLHQELRELKLARIERQVGGVLFQGKPTDAWKANLWLRTAVRVLWRQTRFQARSEGDLYDGVRSIDWDRFLSAEGRLVVEAQTRDSALDHSLFVAQRTKDAIVDQFRDRFGKRPTVDRDNPDLAVHVHLSRDRATVSVDTSGPSLHKRGWRSFQGRAPLAETLAAAIVLMSGWDRRSPLVDPFCGSGTILIEAALIAGGIPPGSFRSFGFESFPDHDPKAWARLRTTAGENKAVPRKLVLRGYDQDEDCIAGARANAHSAGLADAIEFAPATAPELELRRGWNAWIITNPPYGERLSSDAAIKSLYADFGAFLRERCGGYHLALLSSVNNAADKLGLTPNKQTPLKNGKLDCQLIEVSL